VRRVDDRQEVVDSAVGCAKRPGRNVRSAIAFFEHRIANAISARPTRGRRGRATVGRGDLTGEGVARVRSTVGKLVPGPAVADGVEGGAPDQLAGPFIGRIDPGIARGG